MAGIVFNPLLLNGFQFASTSGGGGGGTVTSVGLADSTGLFNITGSPVTTSGTLTLASLQSHAANTVFAAPNGSAGAPTFRLLVAADIPSLSATYANTSLSNLTNPTAFNQSLIPNGDNTLNIGSATRRMAKVFAETLSADSTTNFDVINRILIDSGNVPSVDYQNRQLDDSGGLATVDYGNRALIDSSDFTSIDWEARNLEDTSGTPMFNWTGPDLDALTHKIINVVDPTNPQDAATKNYVDTHSSSGTVTSVSIVSTNGFAGTVATATTTPAITLSTTITGILKGNGTAISAAVSGTDYQPAGNYITALTGDATASGPGSAALTLATVASAGTTGSSIAIPIITINAKGLTTSITTAAVIAPAGTLTGTTLASNVVTSSLTSVGTITSGVWNGTAVAIGFGGTGASTTSQNFAFIGPTSGSGAPSFRALVAGDLPAGTGSVTSVALVDSTGLFNITGSPVTTSGSLTLASFQSQAQHSFFAAPSGSAGAPTFRAIVASDIPTLNQNTTGSAATLTTPRAINGVNFDGSAPITVTVAAGTLTGTTLNATVVTSSLTSVGTQAAALNMGSHKINNVTDPTSAQDAATKAYVDNVAAGINPAVAVQAATTAASDTSGFTYNNGVSGIGATLTSNATNTALTVDGFTFTTLGQRLLVKNDTQSPSGAFNGVYYVTQVQALVLPIILTRALDYDIPSDMNNTGAIPVINGTVNGTTQWVLTSLVNTVGTDPLTFTKFARNPADYLLKANNLSDVSSASTSFNNISPVTTTGDIIYSSSGTTNTRLPIGTAGQVLTVSAGVPTWQPAPGTVSAFFASSQVTTASSANPNTSFATFSNSPAFTFTPSITGTYKVYSNPSVNSSAVAGVYRVFNTTGSATLLDESQGTNNGTVLETIYVQSVYTLTAGTSYVFDLQGKTSSGSTSLNGDIAAFYMFAELEVAGTSAGTPTNTYWSGFHDLGYSWTNANAAYADWTSGAVGTFTERQNSGFGTVTAAASNLPGITFTPASASAVYMVTVTTAGYNPTANEIVAWSLTDGTNQVSTASIRQAGSPTAEIPATLSGIYAPGTSSSVTLKLFGGSSAGTSVMLAPSSSLQFGNAIEWTLVQIK